jgi:hypothetical protein
VLLLSTGDGEVGYERLWSSSAEERVPMAELLCLVASSASRCDSVDCSSLGDVVSRGDWIESG